MFQINTKSNASMIIVTSDMWINLGFGRRSVGNDYNSPRADPLIFD